MAEMNEKPEEKPIENGMKSARQKPRATARRWRTLALSMVSAIVVMLMCYFIDNLPYSFVGDANIGQRIEQIKALHNSSDVTPPDFLLINVAYDRQLTTIYDTVRTDTVKRPLGNIDIADREKLIKLLQELKKTDYRYVVLDLIFPKNISTPADSTLFDLILSMDRIVIAKTHNDSIADDRLLSKARFADYSVHISETNFVKFDYLRDKEATLPYQVYLDLYGDSIRSNGWFYTFNGRPANRSIVLRHPMKIWNKEPILDVMDGYIHDNNYYNLGVDILDQGLNIPEEAEGKIVIVGDFTRNDMHDTYLGQRSGPVILANAIYGLINDNLSIPYSLILFEFVFFTIISYYIIRRKSIFNYLPILKRIRSKTVRLLLSFFSITTLMIMMGATLYLVFGLDIDILIPTLYFSILLFIVSLPSRFKNA